MSKQLNLENCINLKKKRAEKKEPKKAQSKKVQGRKNLKIKKGQATKG
jgi:hypothetical protein